MRVRVRLHQKSALFSPPPLPHLLTFVAGICFIVSRSVLLSTDGLQTKPCVRYNHVTATVGFYYYYYCIHSPNSVAFAHVSSSAASVEDGMRGLTLSL